MKQIKEPKLIEVIANIRYEEKEDTLVQKISFVVPNKSVTSDSLSNHNLSFVVPFKFSSAPV